MKTVLLFLVWMLLPSAGFSQADEVSFQVRVILARQETAPRDPGISDTLFEYLEKTFGGRYQSFRKLEQRGLKVLRGKEGRMPLQDGSELTLVYKDLQGEFVVIDMALRDLKATVRIRDGGLFFQAGHRYQDGVLILAISLRRHGGRKSTPGTLESPRPVPRPSDPPRWQRHERRPRQREE